MGSLLGVCLVFLFGQLYASTILANCVSNGDSIIETHPVFHLHTGKHYVDSIHWQISESTEFDWVSPDLDKTSTSTEEVSLSEQECSQLIPGEIYYFRFKTELCRQCSDWSEPFQFSLGCPKACTKEYYWPKNPSVDEATWNALQPFFLPSNHPLKMQLDAIFSSYRVTANQYYMALAGFVSLDVWKWDKVFVARHPSLPGYLIKAYLDDQVYMDDRQLVQRIAAAENLRGAIKAFGYQSLFKVPRKWLYPLPDSPETLPGLRKKNFILIVEDMNIVDREKNKKLYLKANEKQLVALYHLLNTLGLADSIYIQNIPFSKDGKIAFVDTERHSLWPVPFQKLTPMLNSKMQAFWKRLTGT